MRILFLTHRLPYAPNRGDRIRAYYLLREMSQLGDVTLFSLIHDDDEMARVGSVPFARTVAVSRVSRTRNLIRGALSLPSGTPLTHVLLDAPGAMDTLARLTDREPPDVVVAFCSGMARFALEATLSRYPLVLDMVDVDSAKWRQLGRQTRGPRGWIYRREATTLSAFEAVAAAHAQTTLVVNERERAELIALAPAVRVAVVENGIDVDAFAPKAEARNSATVVFCGVMDYQPNAEGVTWFAETIWPSVRAARPDARFVVVGAGASRALHALAERDRSIEVTGAVPSVQPYLWSAAVSVAPLRLARGLQNKVLEALAARLPVVMTSAVEGGLPREVTDACAVADEPTMFSREILRLLALDAPDRRRIAERAHLVTLSWPERLRPLADILRRATTATR